MNILVVPTIRQECIEKFLVSWKNYPWEIMVVEDNPTKQFKLDCKYHFAWDDIENDLKDKSWIISRKDSAIRCYGFLKAFQLGADYIFTLDDDCYPTDIDTSFTRKHIQNLINTPMWCESVFGFRTRGLPYKNLGYLKNVVMSVGLWQRYGDFDAIQTFASKTGNFYPEPNTRVIPNGQYFPLSGMNLCFTGKIAPICYFPLMDNYKRFDDIWFGIIFKKICDHLRYHIVCGEPCVDHIKASNPFENLIKEAPGIKMNEIFWEKIDGIELNEETPIDCFREISRSLVGSNEEYFKLLGKAMGVWSTLV